MLHLAEPLQLFRLDLVASMEPREALFAQLAGNAVELRTATLELSGAVHCAKGLNVYALSVQSGGQLRDVAAGQRSAWVYEITRAVCVHASCVPALSELPGVWDSGSPPDALLHAALLTGQLLHGGALLEALVGSSGVVERLVRLAELRQWCGHHESTSALLDALPSVRVALLVRHLTLTRRDWYLHQLIPMLTLLSERLAARARALLAPAERPLSHARERPAKRRTVAPAEPATPNAYTINWDRAAADRIDRTDVLQSVVSSRLGGWLKELIVQLAGNEPAPEGSRALALALHSAYLLVCVVRCESRAALQPLLEQLAGVDTAAALPLARVADRLLKWLDHAVRLGDSIALVPYLLELSMAVAWSVDESEGYTQAQHTLEYALQHPLSRGDLPLRFPIDLPNDLMSPFALFRVGGMTNVNASHCAYFLTTRRSSPGNCGAFGPIHLAICPRPKC